jgi:cell wall-associated NlpC family hydrolase
VFLRVTISALAIALFPTTIAAAVPVEEPQPLAVSMDIIQTVNALPQMRLDIQSAADELADARMRARSASFEATVATEHSDLARSQIERYARNAYLTGTPDSIRVATETLDGTIGSLLHDVAMHKYAGSEVAYRAMARMSQAKQVIAGAAIASHEVTLAEQVLAGRQALLAHTEERLRAYAVAVGYPEMVTAAISVDSTGCITRAPDAANPHGAELSELCRRALRDADEYAAGAITWALARLGAPYACQGVGRGHPLFQFDCSSFVSRAYQDGAGVPLWTGVNIPTTATMLAGSGRFTPINERDLVAGDLVLYDSCPPPPEDEVEVEVLDEQEAEACTDRHVVMYLGRWQGREWMVHTNTCGGVANLDHFWGLGEDPGRVFLGAVRVQRPLARS